MSEMVLQLTKEGLSIHKVVDFGAFGSNEITKTLPYTAIPKMDLKLKLLGIKPCLEGGVLKAIHLTVQTLGKSRAKAKNTAKPSQPRAEKLGDQINKMKFLGTVESPRRAGITNRIFETDTAYWIESHAGRHLTCINKKTLKESWHNIRKALYMGSLPFSALKQKSGLNSGVFWVAYTIFRFKGFLKTTVKKNLETGLPNTYVSLTHSWDQDKREL